MLGASYLSGATYHLCMHPEVMKKLTTLIRSSFATEAEITSSSLAQLEYLTAVLKEAGRTYPALPSGKLDISGFIGSTISLFHYNLLYI